MKLFLNILFVLMAAQSFAQIEFQHTTLEEALALAKKENKPLFVDVFATWCGPCKRMAATTFMDPAVAEFYNKNFINLKIDGEKNDGPEVMQKYKLRAYPTLLYFYPNGTLATTFIGGMEVADIMKKGKLTLDPTNNPVYKARIVYFKSKKKTADLHTYLGVMATEKDDSVGFYAEKYMKKKPKLKLSDPVDFAVFISQINDYEHPLSKEFLAHPENYEKAVFLEKISGFLRQGFQTAVAKNDFSVAEKAVATLFPILEAQQAEGLPTQAEFIAFLRGEFDKQGK